MLEHEKRQLCLSENYGLFLGSRFSDWRQPSLVGDDTDAVVKRPKWAPEQKVRTCVVLCVGGLRACSIGR